MADARDRSFRAPLTEQEMGMLHALAGAAGVPVTDWFRSLVASEFARVFPGLDPPAPSPKVSRKSIGVADFLEKLKVSLAEAKKQKEEGEQ